MEKYYRNQFKRFWTTEKDEYCLIKRDTRDGYALPYHIMTTRQKSMCIIEEGPISELLDNMIQAGVRVFETDEEWEAFVESQPGYTTTNWWDEPGVKSPFINPNNPPPSWARAKGDAGE